ncbi:MAG: hypothetical protein JSS04_08360 [Proteobacteria bacterium]|nr:hypothetical protein [Pseudomonadota bacterium]HET9573883.1 hypothetical protein [Methyloceanibacter sp.]
MDTARVPDSPLLTLVGAISWEIAGRRAGNLHLEQKKTRAVIVLFLLFHHS